MDTPLQNTEELKNFLVSKGVLDANATTAAPLLYRAGFTSHNAFHNISAADLRPLLSVPLSNQIVASLAPTTGAREMKELSNTIRRLNKLVKGVATPRPATTFDSDPVWHQQVMDRYTKGQERCMILSQLFPSEIYGINYGRIIAAHIWPKDHAQASGAEFLGIDVNSCSNGLLLCKDIEHYYGEGRIALVPTEAPEGDDYCVVEIYVASSLQHTTIYAWQKWNNNIVRTNQSLGLTFGRLHRRSVQFSPKPSLRALMAKWRMAYGKHPAEFPDPGEDAPDDHSEHIRQWLDDHPRVPVSPQELHGPPPLAPIPALTPPPAAAAAGQRNGAGRAPGKSHGARGRKAAQDKAPGGKGVQPKGAPSAKPQAPAKPPAPAKGAAPAKGTPPPAKGQGKGVPGRGVGWNGHFEGSPYPSFQTGGGVWGPGIW